MPTMFRPGKRRRRVSSSSVPLRGTSPGNKQADWCERANSDWRGRADLERQGPRAAPVPTRLKTAGAVSQVRFRSRADRSSGERQPLVRQRLVPFYSISVSISLTEGAA